MYCIVMHFKEFCHTVFCFEHHLGPHVICFLRELLSLFCFKTHPRTCAELFFPHSHFNKSLCLEVFRTLPRSYIKSQFLS